MADVLVFQGVSKWYGPVIGLSDVSLSLAPGVTGLLGVNGSGKSTMIKLACGLLAPSLGDVRVFGEAPIDSIATRRRLGLVPDVDRFYEDMSARQFVTWMLRLSGHGRREAARRAEENLVGLGLKDAMDKKVAGYSKGMRQRVKLAQALAHDPDLLCLDEPLNGLDPLGRRDVIELVRDLGRRGKSVLVSSHVLHEVEEMTPRMVLIHQGRVLAEGTVREIRLLLRDRPSRVRVRCQAPRMLASEILRAASVASVAVSDDALEVSATRPSEFYRRLTELGADPRSGIEEVEALDDNLQAVFGYLVG